MSAPIADSRQQSTAVASPPARRAPGANWRDPRLVLGVAIVAVSALLGARLLGAADDTVSVWAVRTDLPAGAAVTPTELERRDIGFGSPEVADRYLSADEPPPEGSVVGRALGAGELLPRAALEPAGATELIEVPLAAAAEAVPATVRIGSRVDVWVAPAGTTAEDRVDAELVFDDAVVVAAPRDSSALGPSATRQVIVGLDPADEHELPGALALVAAGDVVLTRQG